VMREHVAGLASVEMRLSCRFEDFSQDTDGVGAELHDLTTGRRDHVRARYLVACCGGRSSVPGSLGIRPDDAARLVDQVRGEPVT